ncbi:MAG: hypothetical protein RPR97_16365 [Colwellia sp.]|jgi:hypothetical protein
MPENNHYILHNPHSFDMLFKPLSYYLKNKKPHLKYNYLLAELFDEDIVFVVDYSESSLLPSRYFTLLPLFIRKALIRAELFFWKRINKLYKFKFFEYDNNLSSFNLVSFTYKSAVHVTKEKISVFEKCNFIAFHLSHYMISTSMKASLIKKFKGKCALLGDVDLTDNSYYQLYFDEGYKFLVVPFQVSERFQNKNKNNEDRSDNVLVSGTVHNLANEEPKEYYSDFISHFKTDSYHEVRSYFSQNTVDGVDSRVSLFREGKSSLQSQYFKIDLVSLLNTYNFVCYDNELSGAPAITTLESIACGCVPLVKLGSLKGLKLENKFHFIEYEGSIDSVLSLIYSLNDVKVTQINTRIREHLVALTRASLSELSLYMYK